MIFKGFKRTVIKGLVITILIFVKVWPMAWHNKAHFWSSRSDSCGMRKKVGAHYFLHPWYIISTVASEIPPSRCSDFFCSHFPKLFLPVCAFLLRIISLNKRSFHFLLMSHLSRCMLFNFCFIFHVPCMNRICPFQNSVVFGLVIKIMRWSFFEFKPQTLWKLWLQHLSDLSNQGIVFNVITSSITHFPKKYRWILLGSINLPIVLETRYIFCSSKLRMDHLGRSVCVSFGRHWQILSPKLIFFSPIRYRLHYWHYRFRNDGIG